MKIATACESCGALTTAATRCTNGRCPDCHRTRCTSGGATEPGHGRGAYVCDRFLATCRDPKRCHICLQPKEAHRA